MPTELLALINKQIPISCPYFSQQDNITLDEIVFLNNWRSLRTVSNTIYKGACDVSWFPPRVPMERFSSFIYLLTNVSPLGKAGPN